MLRVRPDRCPYCGHGVSGALRCARCGEALPDVTSEVSRASEVRGVGGTLGAVIGGSAVLAGVAAAAVVQPLLALGIAVVSPFALGVAGSVVSRARAYARRHARRAAPPSGEAWRIARDALVTRPDDPITVMGRVRLEIPVIEGTDDAVRGGRAGRFVIETDAGEALVDDDGLVADAALVVHDGERVEVTGPARLVHDDRAASEGYRGPATTRIVFDGTLARPLVVRAATGEGPAARPTERDPHDAV
jgi:hypothetical protein